MAFVHSSDNVDQLIFVYLSSFVVCLFQVVVC